MSTLVLMLLLPGEQLLAYRVPSRKDAPRADSSLQDVQLEGSAPPPRGRSLHLSEHPCPHLQNGSLSPSYLTYFLCPMAVLWVDLYPPRKRYAEVPSSGTPKCDLIWK